VPLATGTSKWNKIEHRLFTFITMNWRGRPLVSHHVIVQLIAATTTKTGLTIRCELYQNARRPPRYFFPSHRMSGATNRKSKARQWLRGCAPLRTLPFEIIVWEGLKLPGKVAAAKQLALSVINL
jgi:hypothetical protein